MSTKEDVAINEVHNKRYDAQAELHDSFSDDSVETEASSDKYSKSQNYIQTIDDDSKSVPTEFQWLVALRREYKPKIFPIKPMLKCFIPDYLPSVGKPEVPLLTVPFSYQKHLDIFDEPCLNQSTKDEIEAIVKGKMQNTIDANAVERFESRDLQNSIDAWIEQVKHDIKEDTKAKQTSSTQMEHLVDQWLPEVQTFVTKRESRIQNLLNPSIDLNTEEYISICCAILGLPINIDSSSGMVKAISGMMRAAQHITRSSISQQSD